MTAMGKPDRYEQVATRFVEDQQTVLGTRAWRLADGIDGIVVDDRTINVDCDGRVALHRLCREFQSLFGANVEDCVLEAAETLDRPIELPPSLAVDRQLRGYIEHKPAASWEAADEITAADPQPEIWERLFGFDTDADDHSTGAPIAAERGVPMDASDQVYDAWLEQKRAENGIKIATGHTWLTAGEIPDTILSKAADELVDPLRMAANRFGPDRTRLIAWVKYNPGR